MRAERDVLGVFTTPAMTRVTVIHDGDDAVRPPPHGHGLPEGELFDRMFHVERLLPELIIAYI
jgi:hypothetical protein